MGVEAKETGTLVYFLLNDDKSPYKQNIVRLQCLRIYMPFFLIVAKRVPSKKVWVNLL